MYFHTFSTRVLNETFADAGFIIIGCSFALSGICYFWNFADTHIGYRKYVGIVGFYLAAAHTAIALTRTPLSAFLAAERFTPFLAAVFSMLIFLLMAVVSNTMAIKVLGYAHWKKILQFGYWAYLAGLVHFGMINQERWIRWIGEAQVASLPQLSLVVFVFGSFVLGLRIALWIDTKKKHSRLLVKVK
jgi:DMSO/TMAO reductase YedYZ heme-binding membrane subunit